VDEAIMRFHAWRYKVFKGVESVCNHLSSTEMKELALSGFIDIYRMENDCTPAAHPLQRQV